MRQKLRGFLFFFLIHAVFAQANPIEEHSLFKIPEADREYAQNLEKLAHQEGLVGDFFKLKLAEKQIKQNQLEEAQKTLTRSNAEILKKWRQLIQAEILLAQDKATEALASLPKLPSIPKPELSFGESFYKNLCVRVFWTKYHAKKKLARDTSLELGWLSVLLAKDQAFLDLMKGQPQPVLSLEQKLTKIHNLHSGFQFKTIPGTTTTSEILSAQMPQEIRCRGLYELGDGLRAAGGHAEEAIGALQALVKENCNEEYLAKGLYRLGSLALALRQENTGKAALIKLNQSFPRHRLADDAIYLLLQHYKKFKNAAESKKYAEKLFKTPGDMRDEALFEEAYPHFKKGNFKKAAEIFGRVYELNSSRGESYPRNIYWYARSLEKSAIEKNRGKAKNIYRSLAKDFPFSFYAVLAANRAQISMNIPQLPSLIGTPPEEDVEFFDAVSALNSKGFHTAAGAVLDLALHSHPEWEKNHKEFITRMMMDSQNYRKAIDMAANHFNSGVYGPTQTSTDPMFAALYPQAYRKQINRGYATTHLPRGAIEGIMREESLFQRNAKSWVGATGLMQLMPATAKIVQKKLPAIDLLSDLTDPESNILLGSTYLQNMVQYFDEQLPLAVMAYNAGPGNVNKWLKARGHTDLDEFIEDIPFTETRGYVKRVLRSMNVYGAWYGEAFFKKPFMDFAIRVAKK